MAHGSEAVLGINLPGAPASTLVFTCNAGAEGGASCVNADMGIAVGRWGVDEYDCELYCTGGGGGGPNDCAGGARGSCVYRESVA